jgi:membrane protein implicated in regulation of membrane protease activity
MEYLEQLTFWHWLIFGVLLVGLEMLAPGVVFMWMGIAAGLTGAILVVAPNLSWEYQFLIFALFSVVSIVLGKKFVSGRPEETDQPGLNRRGARYIGRQFILSESITDGEGKLIIDDTIWRITGDDMPKGTEIRVLSMDGTSLKVEKFKPV